MPPLTIRSLNARAVLAPLPRPLRTASGAIPAAPLMLLDVETDQGVPGRAYVLGYSPVTLRALCAFVQDMAELVVGKPVAPAARAGELTRALELLGGEATPLPAYDSFGLVDAVQDRGLLEASIAAGFRAVKIKAGDGSPTEDAKMVAA